jgi:nucleotide-binding universal stress UspA family protein
MFKHILVPTDFSTCAHGAADLAIELATTMNAKLTLMHADWFLPPGYITAVGGLSWAPYDTKLAQRALDRELERVHDRYPSAESKLVLGDTWRSILEAITETKADLVVMGTNGRTGLAHAFVGSIAEKVVRLSPIPVLTVSKQADTNLAQRGSEQADKSNARTGGEVLVF